jgi:hypothetical protein
MGFFRHFLINFNYNKEMYRCIPIGQTGLQIIPSLSAPLPWSSQMNWNVSGSAKASGSIEVFAVMADIGVTKGL